MKPNIKHVLLALVTSSLLLACSSGEASIPGSSSTPASSSGSTSASSEKQGEERYRVSEDYWNANIKNYGYFGPTSNLTLTMNIITNGQSAVAGYLENDYGKIRLNVSSKDAYLSVTSAGYEAYDFDDSDQCWHKFTIPFEEAGNILSYFYAFIPAFSYSDFTYDEINHVYKMDRAELANFGSTVTFTDIVFSFENDKLLYLKYDVEGQGSGELVASKWGTTSVTLPADAIEGQHGNEPTSSTLPPVTSSSEEPFVSSEPEPTTLESIIENKVYVYDHIVCDDPNYVPSEEMLSAEETVVTFFEDKKVEMVLETNVALIGTYSMSPMAKSEYFLVSIYVQTMVYGTLVTDAVERGSKNYCYYDRAADELIFESKDTYLDGSGTRITVTAEVHFAYDATINPTHFEIPTVEDNFDDQAVTAALIEYGYTDTLPHMDGVSTMSIDDKTEEGFTINLTLTDETSFMTYISGLYQNYGFTFGMDDPDGLPYLISPNKQFALYYDSNIDGKIYHAILRIKEFGVYYPAEEMDAWFVEMEYGEHAPDCRVADAVSYAFEEGTLIIFFDNVTEEIVDMDFRYLQDYLCHQGYEYDQDADCFYPRELTYAITLQTMVDKSGYGFIAVNFVGPSYIPLLNFPQEAIDDYLSGVEDHVSVAPLECHGLKYFFFNPGEYDDNAGILLVGICANEREAMMGVSELTYDLNEQGYKKAVVYLYTEEGSFKYHGYVSPNEEILISFDADGKYIFVDIVNLALFPERKIAYVGEDTRVPIAIRAMNYTNTVTQGEEWVFDGVIVAYYEDGTSEIVEEGYEIGDIDTSYPGWVQVPVAYNGVEGIIDVQVLPAVSSMVHYVYQCTNEWDIYADNAKIYVYAWNEAGYTVWAEAKHENLDQSILEFDLPDNCTGFKFVRVAPGTELPEGEWSDDFKPWNQSDDLMPEETAAGSIPTFHFN